MTAGPTYTPIANWIFTAQNAANITFSAIPATYTDLVIVANIYTSGSASGTLRFNYDGSSLYSDTSVYANTTTASSLRHSGQAAAYYTSGNSGLSYQANLFEPIVFHINNYANTTTYKEFITKYGSVNVESGYTVGLWRSTAAINAVTIYTGAAFATGSQFSLYGITAA